MKEVRSISAGTEVSSSTCALAEVSGGPLHQAAAAEGAAPRDTRTGAQLSQRPLQPPGHQATGREMLAPPLLGKELSKGDLPSP